jgi:hypothetical protein
LRWKITRQSQNASSEEAEKTASFTQPSSFFLARPRFLPFLEAIYFLGPGHLGPGRNRASISAKCPNRVGAGGGGDHVTARPSMCLLDVSAEEHLDLKLGEDSIPDHVAVSYGDEGAIRM